MHKKNISQLTEAGSAKTLHNEHSFGYGLAKVFDKRKGIKKGYNKHHEILAHDNFIADNYIRQWVRFI
ncbi:hypothetical protein [Pedobacter jamesrossensis]|uniref:Transposase n=1 Tax=Pedobacter jamesrossensis TaxID=1908238 RepID=A0ABV8NL72_9SPHI